MRPKKAGAHQATALPGLQLHLHIFSFKKKGIAAPSIQILNKKGRNTTFSNHARPLKLITRLSSLHKPKKKKREGAGGQWARTSN